MALSTIHEIYGILYAGKTIQLHFASVVEAETFRVSLHKYKKGQELVLSAADLLLDEDITRLSFEVQRELPEITGSLLTVTVSFKAKIRNKTYEFTVLPDEDPESNEESKDT